MRGKPQAQPEFLTTINLHQRVPKDHPLRGIKQRADQILAQLSPLFDELYAAEGRPSIPPEQLLKSRILMALYSVRSERLFCEQLAYHLLWLWFLDRELDEGSFDPTVFTHNYERVLSADAAKLFFVEVYELSRAEGWTSDQHFTADGTLVEAWASLKSFVRKDGADEQKIAAAKHDDPGNPSVNFRGEQRRNDTHQSTTDPESVLYRKAAGKESKLCFGTQVLMENRHGLCAAITVHNPIVQDEPTVALAQEIRGRLSGMPCLAARGVQGAAARSGTRWPHDRPGRLPHQPEDSQARGGNLWLDEDGGRVAAQPLSRSGTDAGVGLLRGGDLQSAAHSQTGNEFAGWMKDTIARCAAQTGRKTQSKQPSGALAGQASALRSEQ